MSTHRQIDKICCVLLAAVLALTVLFINAESLGIQPASVAIGYENRLFDISRVHTINILMDDWEDFISSCTDEKYTACTVVIDDEPYKNVGLRAKGNTSLSQVQAYGNDRYSFKIEFDHYDSGKSYHGLDKLCLNNIIQDNTYMKDYLSYRLMGEFDVCAPLCSYVYITVNGEGWGLYLAVEGVEEGFLSRNYKSSAGELYKPDSMNMGGGPGNGRGFQMNEWKAAAPAEGAGEPAGQPQGMPQNAASHPFGEMQGRPPDENLPVFSENAAPAGGTEGEAPSFGEKNIPQPDMGKGARPEREGGFPDGDLPGSRGSSDVSLIYTDDSYESYSNIFDNAKTDVSDRDKDRLIASLKNVNEQVNLENSVDIEQVIRYFVVHNFVLNFDSYTGGMIHNYYLYEQDGKLSMIPWDYNLAFGGFEASRDAKSLINYPIDSPVSGGSTESRPMLAWIFADEEYTALYHRYFSEFIAGQFESGAFSEMMSSVKEMISPYVEKDPTKFCSYEEFLTGIDTLKEFCLLRAESVRGQLEGTIAATSEGQQNNQDNLVSAGSLSVSAMGSMHSAMGAGKGGQRQNRPAAGSSSPPKDSSLEDVTAGEAPPLLEGGSFFRQDAPPDKDKGFPPDGFNTGGTSPAGISAESWILLGASAALLLLGICIALFFRRRTRSPF
jgi:spore coat protein CotH